MSADPARLYARLSSLIGVGRVLVSRAIEGKGARRYQIGFDETERHDETPAVQHYGFASRAKAGADAVVIFPGGNRTGGIIVAFNDRRYQLELVDGEVVVHDDQGQKVHLTRAGIVVDGGGKPIRFQNSPQVTADTPVFHCTGKITSGGNMESAATVKAATDVTAGSRSFIGHTHPHGAGAGVTGAPS